MANSRPPAKAIVTARLLSNELTVKYAHRLQNV